MTRGRPSHADRPAYGFFGSLETPNSCDSCHADKTAQWAAEAVVAWH